MTSYFALVDCGSLSDPANGLVTVTTTTLGSTANYSCSPKYQIGSYPLRICQANGNWSGNVPSCTFESQDFTTEAIAGSVAAVFVSSIIFLTLVVCSVLYYQKRVKTQSPAYRREHMVFELTNRR